MNPETNIQNTPNEESPGLFKNIVTDAGKAALASASTIPGAVVSQLSNKVNDIGVYLVGMPIQGIEQNENAIVAKVKEIFTKLDDIDNRLGSDEDLRQIRKKITNRLIEVVGGSIDDLVNNEKLAATLNNLLDKLQRVGVNTAKVFLTAGESIILEVPGLGAVAAIVITGTKVVVAGSSVIASLLAMIQTGAIVANTSGEFVKKIAGAINDFTTSPLIKQPTLPNINEMRASNRNLENNIRLDLPVAQALPVANALPTINQMRESKSLVGGGANYLKTLTRRKNSIEKRISGSIGNFMNNKLTKKRRRHKYTHKRHSRR
jgi:hypothetical protein